MSRILAILMLTCLPVQVLAQSTEPAPCFQIESDVIDLEPRTDLEKIYFGAAVCFKKQRDVALAQVRSSSTSLAARTPEAIATITSSVALAQIAEEDAHDNTPLYVALSFAIGAILGGGAVLILR